MEENFLKIVINEFSSNLLTKDLSLLYDRLFNAAKAVDNECIDEKAKSLLIHELRGIRSEYIKSEYVQKWKVHSLLCQMEARLLQLD